MKKYYVYPAIFDDSENEPGTYTVTFPDVPGAITDGVGISEAIIRAEECLEGFLITFGGEYKDSSLYEVQQNNPGKIVNYVVADMLRAKKYIKDKMINKNVRIPARLAEKR
ncbi:type II toxin-antitoxin system HicB family antitoxin [Lactobacillus sp. ESL0703]|uniref:type II toxin-antitoxin system HicB family antitoxin n=1 Tax=Lactobacillus sp. ESL0703 TaxID=2983218 RepID=UPI0023F87BDA|nr:type II toxin-antitoxin system HicB family antitoxin [Lactobacillus sp. ESL0703]MDF7669421.1 type II toxin-antitoxin system HicB family antitoxin [Lactobacillus sp. ESL0703]